MEYPRFIVGTYQCNDEHILLNVVRESLSCGLYGFDTAPSYKTENILGNVLNTISKEQGIDREQFCILDKIDAWQMRKNNGNIRCFVEDALRKLRTDYIDIMFIHWPVSEYFERTWESLQKCKEDGIIRETGICNVRVRHLLEWKSLGIVPSCVQIERHPLRTCRDEMNYCNKNGIKVFSYSPLGRMIPQICDSEILKKIASKYEKNIGQIILRWQIDTNTYPIFTSTRLGRIKSNTDVFDFQLTESEISQIELMNINYKIFLESWGCPGF